jgi:hypothetical protein
MKLNIEIDNLTEAQALAIEDYLATWLFLKEKKMSMWVSFFADGFEGFAPEIKVNGDEAKKYMGDIGWRVAKVGLKNSPEDEAYSDEEMYLMDYYRIQKKLDENTEG